MLLQLSVIRKIASFFEQRDTEFPYPEQPIRAYGSVVAPEEYVVDAHAFARRSRATNFYIFPEDTYPTVIRTQEFVGTDASIVNVPDGKFLTANVTIIGSDGKLREVTFSFESGEQFSKAKFEKLLTGTTAPAGLGSKKARQFVQQSIKHTDFYLTEFVPKIKP